MWFHRLYWAVCKCVVVWSASIHSLTYFIEHFWWHLGPAFGYKFNLFEYKLRFNESIYRWFSLKRTQTPINLWYLNSSTANRAIFSFHLLGNISSSHSVCCRIHGRFLAVSSRVIFSCWSPLLLCPCFPINDGIHLNRSVVWHEFSISHHGDPLNYSMQCHSVLLKHNNIKLFGTFSICQCVPIAVCPASSHFCGSKLKIFDEDSVRSEYLRNSSQTCALVISHSHYSLFRRFGVTSRLREFFKFEKEWMRNQDHLGTRI